MNFLHSKIYHSIKIPFILLIIFFVIKISELLLNTHWSYMGILPRQLSGLMGIVFSPFIHGDIKHLFSNAIPFFVLLSLLNYFYKSISTKVLLFSWFFIGIGVWICARESYHIGASGLIYSFFSFLVLSGIYRKQKALLAISLLIIFLYGSIIWGVLPQDIHISWESHLIGLGVGVLLAIYYRNNIQDIVPEKEIEEDIVYRNAYWNDVIES